MREGVEGQDGNVEVPEEDGWSGEDTMVKV